VTHATTDMAMMEGPSKSSSGSITWVDHTRDVGGPDKATLPPLLGGRALGTDMSRTGGRLVLTSHVDRSHVVFTQRHGTSLRAAQLAEDRAKVPGDLGSGHGGSGLTPSRGGGDSSLGLGLACCCTSSTLGDKASDRSAGLDFTSVSSVDVSSESVKRDVGGPGGPGVLRQGWQINTREG